MSKPKPSFEDRYVLRKDYEKLHDHWHKVWQQNIRLRAQLQRMKEKQRSK